MLATPFGLANTFPTEVGYFKENTLLMNLDDLFEGGALLGEPSSADEYLRKQPGFQDANGDHG